jgi:hypothetical protein
MRHLHQEACQAMRITVALILAALATNLPAAAQEKMENAVYKVEFNIHDGSDAAAKASRRYTMLVLNNQKSVFKVGDKVPYTTGDGQYSYLDTGVNIDCYAREVNEKVAIHGEIDLSTVAPPDKRPAAGVPNPTIAQTHIVIDAILNSGKPLLVAAIDDPVSTRKFDVEATVSKVN